MLTAVSGKVPIDFPGVGSGPSTVLFVVACTRDKNKGTTAQTSEIKIITKKIITIKVIIVQVFLVVQ